MSRALQIALGAPALVKVSKDITPFEIAKQEMEAKILPLSVIRIFPSGENERVEIN